MRLLTFAMISLHLRLTMAKEEEEELWDGDRFVSMLNETEIAAARQEYQNS